VRIRFLRDARHRRRRRSGSNGGMKKAHSSPLLDGTSVPNSQTKSNQKEERSWQE